MTEPEPQPRDIALEMATPDQATDLETQSEPAEDPPSRGSGTGC